MAKDWRLEQLERAPQLSGVAFVRKAYRKYREDWDHDHCVACWATLAEPGYPDPEARHEGYATTAAFVRGADYEWVCVECFDAFRDVMRWVVEAPPADPR